ncbi:protein-L-isoaspartate O-methyltransferase [Nitzschia inconspicua]|uniref:Protein-L-isoaspartate O-methyltransferase n=1 Tax=Nitzschia inconspicua TaxID=303405 RepID=A0A9K3Q548_9STRA|nr:protein-L-isoaspartate O-methyltransferase [Nitzschia inconspicua]
MICFHSLRPSTRVDTADNIVTFLRSNVFVHEQHFARCFYVDVRGFDAYSNTCLEGTNYGVKYCENRVLPNMSQAKATKVMINQDEDKFTQNRKKASDAFHKTPLQARTNTSAHVLQTADSMLQQAMVASESYISYRVCERKWWVLYSGHRNLPVRLLPVFERFGTNFESFTHQSVDIRFWTAYSLYSVVLDPSELNEDELNIRNKLVTARWKSPQTPTAPASTKSMDEGRYSVGSKSEDKFMSMTGDETSDVADPVGSHEVLNPLYKELTQLCDIAGKDKTAKTARDLETLIIALKEEITSEQSPPTGKVVSCMVSKVSEQFIQYGITYGFSEAAIRRFLADAPNNAPVKFKDFNVQDFMEWIVSVRKEDGSTPTSSTYNCHRAGLFNLFRDYKQDIAPLQSELKTHFRGLQRTKTQALANGEGGVKIGKDALEFALYKSLCLLLMKSAKPDYVFIHCFMTYCWNLMCRAGNMTSICWSHLLAVLDVWGSPKAVSSFAKLSRDDMPSTNMRKRLSDLRYLMQLVEKRVEEQGKWIANPSIEQANEMFEVGKDVLDISDVSEKGRKRRGLQMKWTSMVTQFFRPNSGNNSGVMRAWTCHGRNQRDLVEKLKQAGIIKTPEVAKVLEQVDRANFIPRNSYMDAPQAIGMGQTISAPHMHAHVLEEMLSALVGKENVKILDVGCGSGYLTAALGRWVSSKHDVPGSGNILGVRSGKVFGIDVHQDLVDLTKENIRKQDGDLLQRDVVKVMLRDGWKGLKEEAPFDAIHVGAAADSLPLQLVSQLKVNGVMIIPIGLQTEAQILYKIHRIRETPGEGDSFHPEDFEMSTLLGVRYVPLVHTETN